MQLGRNRLLAALPESEYSRLHPYIVHTTFVPGRVLYEAGHDIPRICFPHSGLIALQVFLPNEGGIGIATVGTDGAVGLGAGLGMRVASCHAVVQTAMRAACIATTRFAALLQESPALKEMAIHGESNLQSQMHKSAACHAVHHLEGRFASWMLRASHCLANNAIDVTQQYLSEILGAQRTSITLISRLLQAEGIIDVRRGHIRIVNRHALAARACGCFSEEPQHVHASDNTQQAPSQVVSALQR